MRPNGLMAWLVDDQKSLLPMKNVWLLIEPAMATPTSPLPIKGVSTVSPLFRFVGGEFQAPVYCWTIRIAWFAVIESAAAGWDVVATMTAVASSVAVAAAST